ncbi:Rpn family recombination-promoting nuclease/putative transposase [Paenibacillus dendritiformis]|uniref:Rpn family recombination-promoting nuclease/putative transposase n=1 Tax=Paenibacillus dendritiformis TaxID=130049 RepID=UPI0031F54B06
MDETNVQEIPHSYVLQDFKRKEADLVYRVKLNGQDVVFYLLLEMQSRVDFLMPYRLLLYQVEIWRYLMKDQEKRRANRKHSGCLPLCRSCCTMGRDAGPPVANFASY